MIEYTDINKANARIKELEFVRDEAFNKIAELQKDFLVHLKQTEKESRKDFAEKLIEEKSVDCEDGWGMVRVVAVYDIEDLLETMNGKEN